MKTTMKLAAALAVAMLTCAQVPAPGGGGGGGVSGPAGSNTQVQYNNAGTLAGAECTYDSGTQVMTCPGGFTSGATTFLVSGGTQTQPATPAAGQMRCWFHSADDSFRCVNAAGTVTTLGIGTGYALVVDGSNASQTARTTLKTGAGLAVADDGSRTVFSVDTAAHPTLATMQAGTPYYAADSEASDAYVACPATSIGSLTQGMTINLRANTANTGGATLNLCTLGAKAILKQRDTALATGDVEAGQVVTLAYDSAGDGGSGAWQMQSQTAAAASGGITSINADSTAAQVISGTDGVSVSTSGGTTTIGSSARSSTAAMFFPNAYPWSTVPSNVTAEADVVMVVRVFIPARFAATKLAFRVGTGTAASTCDVGFYSSDGNTKLLSTGAISTATNGNKTSTVSYTFAAGDYIAAYTCSTATTLRLVGASDDSNIRAILNDGATTVQYGSAANTASAGALPATLGAITAADGTPAHFPYIILRAD